MWKDMSRIVLKSKGVKALLKSSEMAEFCKRKASEIAKKSGDGYWTDFHVGRTRVNASVSTATRKAMLDNSENNTLIKNVR